MYNLHAFVDLQIPISKNVASLLLVSQHFLSCSTVHWQIGNIGKKERVKVKKWSTECFTASEDIASSWLEEKIKRARGLLSSREEELSGDASGTR